MSKNEYGTSYFGVRDPKHARRDLDRFVESGLNAVLHTFSERDQRYYRGTMEEIVTASHERNLTVYVNPWAVGNVFGGEALTEFPAHHPGARQQLSNGDRVPAACFNAPVFRDFMRQWVEDAAGTGADVLFWDEPHWFEPQFRGDEYPAGPWTCRCPHCRSRYEKEVGESMPETLTDQIRAFKTRSILDFLEELTIASARAGAKNAVCLAPEPDTEDIYDFGKFAALEHVDLIGATPFWDFHDQDPEEFVGTWAEKITTVTSNYEISSQVWIQGFALDASKETMADFGTALRTAKSYDPDSLFLWGWDGCRVMSSIACEAPETIWREFLKNID